MTRFVRKLPGIAITLIAVSFQTASAGVEIKSKAAEITLTGRVHTQFNTTSVEGELGSEFFIRRARITAEVKLNGFVSGKVQPDFGLGEFSLKDAYSKFTFSPQFQVYAGQFKRPFDIFQLASSVQMLVTERTGKIRGASGFTSLSGLTESLHYSDRDIGVLASFQSKDKLLRVDAAVTNGDGSHNMPSMLSDSAIAVGEKQFTGRVTVKLPIGQKLALSAGATALPVLQPEGGDLAAADDANPEVEYATAFEASAELGDFEQGLHIRAGAIFGDNWKLDRAEKPSFTAVQGIVTYKHPVPGNGKVTAVAPVFRISWADPNTDADDDAGILITPGIQVFFIGMNKVSLNVDVFLPQWDDLPGHEADTEYSIKAQTYLYF